MVKKITKTRGLPRLSGNHLGRKTLVKSRLEDPGRRQTVYNIIHKLRMLDMDELMRQASKEKVDEEELKEIVVKLKQKGLVYSPKRGFLGCVD